MKSFLTRRNLVRGAGAAVLARVVAPWAATAQQEKRPWWLGDGMLQESANTPKIACAIDVHNGPSDEEIRRVVQLGVCHVLSGGPEMPWSVSELRSRVAKLEPAGLTLGNLMISGFPKTVYGRPG
ncbi:MAG TPA: hypothetical protein VFD98_04030, partial [Terracidiphilus sp.]|nr:hypothetical protein [Terracidiphilus sp.]